MTEERKDPAQAEPTPLALTVTKKQPSHWLRSLSNSAIVLLGTGAFHIDTNTTIGKSNGWVAGAKLRDSTVNAKLDKILRDDADGLIHDTIHDTVYYKLP